MVKIKMMNQSSFDKLSNNLVSFSEMIKTRQDEKQSLLNEFDEEVKRYNQGKISENTFKISVRKKTKELQKLDKDISNAILKGIDLSKKISTFARDQKPVLYRVGLNGISGGAIKSKVKKKVATKKKSVKKVKMTKAEIAKEMKTEKKLIQ